MNDDKNQNRINLSFNNELSDLGKKVISTNRLKKTKLEDFSINDINNFISSDRKLVINDTYEFWVHDIILKANSNYFNDIFSKKKKKITKEEEINLDGIIKPKTYIDIPQSEFFFDILIWIYSKDSKRLLLTANEPENYLSLLTLGIYLELCDDFFNCLIENCEIKLDEKLIKLNLWSRFCFNFEVLIHLIELIPKKNYLLIFYALLSWLKEDNSLKICNENDDFDEREFELNTSEEFFKVKDYIQSKKLMKKLTIEDLYKIKINFPKLVNALDIDFLLEKFESNKIEIRCQICGKKFNNFQEFSKVKCENKLYHPKKFLHLQRQINQINNKCEHEGCNKKIAINEYPCCHKPAHVEGCLQSNGIHILHLN